VRETSLQAALPRLCIAAGSSGSGKTTFTCGLLGALIRRGLKPASFKCGPDYIDPMFHREVTGAPSANLDLFFFNEGVMRYLLHENTRGRDIAVLEGVMGFYDGLGGSSTEGSTWHIAEASETPVLLVENCAAVSLTAAARIKGMASFRTPSRIKGVILNNCGKALYGELKNAIQGETGIEVYGYVPHLKGCVIESRHLGLVTAAEIKDLREKINTLTGVIEESVDIDGLIALAKSAPPLPEGTGIREPLVSGNAGAAIRIGIARDEAFCFYYQDNLSLLQKLGAEPVEFSPLRDGHLLAGIQGVYLGGGYPELYGRTLSENKTMLKDIKDALQSGMPCIAECGGFMYLHETLTDGDGNVYPLVGLLKDGCRKTPRLVRFGYASYTSLGDTLICPAGSSIRGHEFHYWESDNPGGSFIAQKPVSKKEWSCIEATETLCAGFPHFHFYSNPGAARRFLEKCAGYRNRAISCTPER
jgi:cobyrinic acid a,c-diamide synthase